MEHSRSAADIARELSSIKTPTEYHKTVPRVFDTHICVSPGVHAKLENHLYGPSRSRWHELVQCFMQAQTRYPRPLNGLMVVDAPKFKYIFDEVLNAMPTNRVIFNGHFSITSRNNITIPHGQFLLAPSHPHAILLYRGKVVVIFDEIYEMLKVLHALYPEQNEMSRIAENEYLGLPPWLVDQYARSCPRCETQLPVSTPSKLPSSASSTQAARGSTGSSSPLSPRDQEPPPPALVPAQHHTPSHRGSDPEVHRRDTIFDQSQVDRLARQRSNSTSSMLYASPSTGEIRKREPEFVLVQNQDALHAQPGQILGSNVDPIGRRRKQARIEVLPPPVMDSPTSRSRRRKSLVSAQTPLAASPRRVEMATTQSSGVIMMRRGRQPSQYVYAPLVQGNTSEPTHSRHFQNQQPRLTLQISPVVTSTVSNNRNIGTRNTTQPKSVATTQAPTGVGFAVRQIRPDSRPTPAQPSAPALNAALGLSISMDRTESSQVRADLMEMDLTSRRVHPTPYSPDLHRSIGGLSSAASSGSQHTPPIKGSSDQFPRPPRFHLRETHPAAHPSHTPVCLLDSDPPRQRSQRSSDAAQALTALAKGKPIISPAPAPDLLPQTIVAPGPLPSLTAIINDDPPQNCGVPSKTDAFMLVCERRTVTNMEHNASTAEGAVCLVGRPRGNTSMKTEEA
ncbi:hypothetical protein DL96DRAFT_1819461 [Flagelloscypha sp. PMI_526]|nr:hypothetical protein DL96DRAFT_1819461 [Flagelloscypha sp. PMI_526]